LGDLSKNFSRWEFECSCCGALEISTKLINALQHLRDEVRLPIHINSGYRCKKHNARLVKTRGAAKHSYHLKGLAADLVILNRMPQDMFWDALKIDEFRHGGIGVYDSFIHVDVRDGVARWGKIVQLKKGIEDE